MISIHQIVKQVKKDVNVSKVKKQIQKEVAANIEAQFEKEINFGSGFKETHRRNKEVIVSNSRNTVDLGKLKASVQLYWEFDNLVVTLTEEYSSFVLYGYVTKSGSRLPSRYQLIDQSEENFKIDV